MVGAALKDTDGKINAVRKPSITPHSVKCSVLLIISSFGIIRNTDGQFCGCEPDSESTGSGWGKFAADAIKKAVMLSAH